MKKLFAQMALGTILIAWLGCMAGVLTLGCKTPLYTQSTAQIQRTPGDTNTVVTVPQISPAPVVTTAVNTGAAFLGPYGALAASVINAALALGAGYYNKRQMDQHLDDLHPRLASPIPFPPSAPLPAPKPMMGMGGG